MMVRDLAIDPQDLSLEFMGFFDAQVYARFEKLAAAHGLEPFLAIHRGQPRPKALEFMADCTVLVTLRQGATCDPRQSLRGHAVPDVAVGARRATQCNR
jgi:hypothetical protein